MAPALATSRLRKELVNLHKDPPPGVIAEPQENDILTWYYAIRGPADAPYEGGVYIGKLRFTPEYPMKAPSIYMSTPSGRFAINAKLCMSMSDFHPESWNPLWSVSSIIQGIQSFMASDELTTGGMQATSAERKRLAAASSQYNAKTFPKLFGGNIEAAFARADEARTKSAAVPNVIGRKSTVSSSSRRRTNAKKTETEDEMKQSEEKKEEQANEQHEDVPQLTPEEAEKRRKKNAQKRAKQKARKAATKAQADETATYVGDAS